MRRFIWSATLILCVAGCGSNKLYKNLKDLTLEARILSTEWSKVPVELRKVRQTYQRAEESRVTLQDAAKAAARRIHYLASVLATWIVLKYRKELVRTGRGIARWLKVWPRLGRLWSRLRSRFSRRSSSS